MIISCKEKKEIFRLLTSIDERLTLLESMTMQILLNQLSSRTYTAPAGFQVTVKPPSP